MKGVVKVRVVPPDGSGIRATTRNGRASASLEPSGRLVVSGDVDRESDAGFAAEGRFSSGGWEGGSGAVELRIGPDGSIAGGGIADDGNRMEIEGRVDHLPDDRGLASQTPHARILIEDAVRENHHPATAAIGERRWAGRRGEGHGA